MFLNSKYVFYLIYRIIYSYSINVMVIEEVIIDLMDFYLIINNIVYKKIINNRIIIGLLEYVNFKIVIKYMDDKVF